TPLNSMVKSSTPGVPATPTVRNEGLSDGDVLALEELARKQAVADRTRTQPAFDAAMAAMRAELDSECQQSSSSTGFGSFSLVFDDTLGLPVAATAASAPTPPATIPTFFDSRFWIPPVMPDAFVTPNGSVFDNRPRPQPALIVDYPAGFSCINPTNFFFSN
ncbi:hypothetical protein HDU82_000569, partial [Entophlyctis luteolus]